MRTLLLLCAAGAVRSLVPVVRTPTLLYHKPNPAVISSSRSLVRAKGIFDKLRNPFDGRPGATVGLLQLALGNAKGQASRFVGEEASKFDGGTARGLARFVQNICTGLCRRDADWRYASAQARYFDGGATERSEHERFYNRLVNGEAAKFEKEYTPSAAELAKASEEDDDLGLCVVSIVVALEGDMREEIFEGAEYSVPSMRKALTSLGSAAMVQGGEELYNAEVLWTPSSPTDTLLREDMLLDFPELLVL